jgi:hypothetical protein
MVCAACVVHGQTVALWTFDEPQGLYPSSVLDDASGNDYPLVLGLGGRIVPGRFGNALEPLAQPVPKLPATGPVLFGLAPPPAAAGRTVEPITWKNALFCALMTSGERHLRKEVTFVNPTRCALNLGAFDWTAEFWYFPTRAPVEEGVVFEIGTGPRGENRLITKLSIGDDARAFLISNGSAAPGVLVPTRDELFDPGKAGWHHFAFVYSAGDSRLRHFVDGVEQPGVHKLDFRALPEGDEAYMSLGRDGLWNHPLPGRIDELRISRGQVYRGNFTPPASFARPSRPVSLKAGPPLLFAGSGGTPTPIPLMGRKHLFLDGALARKLEAIVFTPHPPRFAERVIDSIRGPFRKHLTVVEDSDGLLRMYFAAQNDFLAVLTSRDGLAWEKPRLRDGAPDMQNVVIAESAGTGSVFIDPNATPDARWKYVSGYEGRGVYLYTSADGWKFDRIPTAAIPLRSGSQSNVFYDDQRQLFVGYHRSDFPVTAAGHTQREFVRTETQNILPPWPFTSLTRADIEKIAAGKRLNPLIPWYLDNGPLTPGGFSVEYPTTFAPDDSLDPPGTDIYVPKAQKYLWAPDAYLAFPLMYFHYEGERPATRRTLGDRERGLGSGPIEAQLAVSRDGVVWKRFPRPAYAGVGEHAGDRINQVYLAQGMIRRGDEIWQYYFGEEAYHSSWRKDTKRAVYRLVQRLDGFVSADAPYDREGTLITRPLIFQGNRLTLNIDTGAAGYATVGLLDGEGRPIAGFAPEQCVYVNGNNTAAEVEWMGKGKDVGALQGKPVQILIRMRGASLYALQFTTAGS